MFYWSNGTKALGSQATDEHRSNTDKTRAKPLTLNSRRMNSGSLLIRENPCRCVATGFLSDFGFRISKFGFPLLFLSVKIRVDAWLPAFFRFSDYGFRFSDFDLNSVQFCSILFTRPPSRETLKNKPKDEFCSLCSLCSQKICL